MINFSKSIQQLVDINYNHRLEEHKHQLTFTNYRRNVASIHLYVGCASDFYTEINELCGEFKSDHIIIVKNLKEKEIFENKTVFTEEDINFFRHRTSRYRLIFVLNPTTFTDIDETLSTVFTSFDQIVIFLGK